MSLAINHPGSRALWSAALLKQSQGESFFHRIGYRSLTPEQQVESARAYEEHLAAVAVHAAKIPAFLDALRALCDQHGVSIKADDEQYYSSFDMSLGLAPIHALDIEAK